MSYFEACS